MLEKILTGLINEGMKSIWLYKTTDSGGAELFQLLDEYGGELAWRWRSDGGNRWRETSSLLAPHPTCPSSAVKYDLSDGLEKAVFLLGFEDIANGSEVLSRPDWCR
ncbi:hypothetical protein OQJ40_27220 [Serratia nevei]|uniref:hypothetical protein n=1 Tax=Serratia nevei TaxID=2703794 RepID=UPI0027D26F82|nr:hypothetical protein [Serratia nevei]WMC78456.1 hypothetical protein O8I25_26965 [Serratia nevei]WMC83886.1 hypothetical protein O8I24_27205 [Serratia nevei]